MRKFKTFIAFLILVMIVFLLASCAGSNYAVKQNELAKRYYGGPKTIILKGKYK